MKECVSNMCECLPSFDDLAWGAFMYWVSSYGGNIGGDQAYVELFKAQDFLRELRQSPEIVSSASIREYLIRFLNQWRCQLADSEDMAERIRGGIIGITEMLHRFDTMTLLGVDMHAHKSLVRQIATKLDDIHGLGPTSTAKILHVLNPAVFIPWDQPVRKEFGERSRSWWYDDFLVWAQKVAHHVRDDFKEEFSPDDEPEAYLSRKLDYSPPKTLAKFIDEFFWIKVTKGIHIPPPWHPGIQSAIANNRDSRKADPDST
jgi:hypothetical protein